MTFYYHRKVEEYIAFGALRRMGGWRRGGLMALCYDVPMIRLLTHLLTTNGEKR